MQEVYYIAIRDPFRRQSLFLDRYYIGVGGTVTFKNNRKTKELVKELSLDRIVLDDRLSLSDTCSFQREKK